MKQAPKSNRSKPGSNHSITGAPFMNDLLFILEKERKRIQIEEEKLSAVVKRLLSVVSESIAPLLYYPRVKV